ncbi:hypothetical protein [Candidatus Spongiihabitans sp.]|uniref:hypothetical protein n=1 Tax=Candidatus Spongiihabitans sp. TaxID=3101308 RepID=UPI003C7C376B
MNTLAVMETGEKTGGARLVAALSAIAVAYTIGGVIGPAASGAALQIFPPHGFMLAAAVAAVAFLVVVGRRKEKICAHRIVIAAGVRNDEHLYFSGEDFGGRIECRAWRVSFRSARSAMSLRP